MFSVPGTLAHRKLAVAPDAERDKYVSPAFSAAKPNLNLKPHGAANLLGGIEVLRDGMLVCNDVCWADGNRRTTGPNLHRKRLQILSEVLGCDMRMLGLGTNKSNQFPDMCNVMQICAAPAFWFRYDRWQCDGEKLPTFSACGIPEIVDRKPQLIDSILEACQQCRGIRNAFENNASAIATLPDWARIQIDVLILKEVGSRRN